MRNFKQVPELLKQEIWGETIEERSRFAQLIIYLVRLVYGVVGKLTEGKITLWAMGLAYTTILSLVPLLAVSFSVLKAFGAHHQLEPLLLESLEPLGEQGVTVAENILSFVENIRVGVLGSLGIALLFYTVIWLLHTVEQAFNAIWHVPNTRRLVRRFSDYLSVILVGPVLIFAALGLTASAMGSAVVQSLAAIEPLGSIIVAISRTVPYLLICGAFAFFYAFITNTRVRPSAALAGGIFAGVFWYATGMIFATFVASSSNYSGVYSGFAGAALFIIWLQIGWLVILLGAQVACYWQHPYLLNLRDGTGDLLGCRCESLALEIMTLIGQAYYHNQPLWTSQTLETRYGGIPAATISGIVQNLLRRKFILATNDDPPLYLPAHDIGTIDLAAVTKAVRAEDEFVSRLPAVDTVMRQIDEAITHTLQGKTLRDLISGNSVTEPLSRQKSFKSGANESNESYAGE